MTPDATAALVTSAVAAGDSLPRAPGVTGTIGLVVTGTAEGDIKVRVRLVDGRPVEAGSGSDPDPDLTLTLTSADAGAVARGALDPSVAFMRGRLKTVGDNGLLLRLLAAAADPGFGSWIAGIAPTPERS